MGQLGQVVFNDAQDEASLSWERGKEKQTDT